MRIGFNPNKDQILEKTNYYHQVIIPVYIPDQEGYFKDSFQILQYCLESLFKTSHSKTFYTVVNNGCCIEVRNYLDDLFRKKEIHEVIHTSNIGKLNAILKGLVGQNFPLVSITDADVLFLNGWQKATYEIFENFSKTGAVCPTPSSKVLKQFTSNVILENLFSKKLQFTEVKNKEALIHFGKSIGNPDFYNAYHLEKNLTITNNSKRAVIGAGHYVATYNSAVFKTLKNRYTDFRLGGFSEQNILDIPVLNAGLWRLSTEDNFTYHMGNTKEKWMTDLIENLKNEELNELSFPNLKSIRNTLIDTIKNQLQNLFFQKIFRQPFIWRRFLRYKGLSKNAAKYY